MSDAIPPLPVAAHHGNGDFALSVIPYYTAKQMHEFAAAAVRAALASPQPAPTVPELMQRGWLLEWLGPGGKRSTVWSDSDSAAKAVGCPHEPVYALRGSAPQEPQR